MIWLALVLVGITALLALAAALDNRSRLRRMESDVYAPFRASQLPEPDGQESYDGKDPNDLLWGDPEWVNDARKATGWR